MIGRTLSQFRITAKLGEGGMGEVYRATDTKLGRDVAIKVLPADFTEDSDRLSRFEREARLLASLNHQNIAGIHQVEQVEGTHFLVMELVEGLTLAEKIAAGALPVEEALSVAQQIASGLEAAHEKGIVHRDLKPANVKLTPEGRIKVLDFGLAKAWSAEKEQADLSESPTMTAPLTQAGVILGTAPYMSPEQAKGRPTDRRSDIWAFGVLLWEMLTGRRLFEGDSVAETLATVLKSDPDFEPLPKRTPPRIRRLMERCLRRDLNSRLRDIGDARIVLEESITAQEWNTSQESGARTTPRVPAMGAALLIAAGLAVGIGLTSFWPGGQETTSADVTSVVLPIGPTLRVGDTPLLTPDGRTTVFRAIDVDPEASDHRPAVYTRRLEGKQIVKLNGSEGAIAHALSPDGEWIAFVAPVSKRFGQYQLMKVPVDRSAPPLKLSDWPDRMSGWDTVAPSSPQNAFLVWATPERILGIRARDRAILPFSSDGGPPGAPIEIRSDMKTSTVWVHSALPAGRHILVYYSTFESGAYRQDVGLLDSETGDLRHLIDDAARPWYAPTGHIVFSRRDALLAAPFDTQRLEVTAGAQSVLDGLWSEGRYTGGTFSVSASGDLLYGAGRVQGMFRSLAILSRNGEATSWSDDRLFFNKVWGSPDGRRLAAQIDNAAEGDALLQIRVSEINRPRLLTMGAQPGMDCGSAAWSTDSRNIVYLCWNQEVIRLYSTRVEGASSSRLLLEESMTINLELVGLSAADSSIFLRRVDTGGSMQLVSVPFDPSPGSEPTSHRITMDEDDWSSATLSPDGSWLAYIANEAGRRELFVRRVLGDTLVGPRILASSEVGDRAIWSNSMSAGRYELIYLQDQQHSALEMITEPSVHMSDPRRLDHDPFVLGIQWVDSLPDGRLLVVRAPDTEMGAPGLGLVLNWTQQLAQQVPAPGK